MTITVQLQYSNTLGRSDEIPVDVGLISLLGYAATDLHIQTDNLHVLAWLLYVSLNDNKRLLLANNTQLL